MLLLGHSDFHFNDELPLGWENKTKGRSVFHAINSSKLNFFLINYLTSISIRAHAWWWLRNFWISVVDGRWLYKQQYFPHNLPINFGEIILSNLFVSWRYFMFTWSLYSEGLLFKISLTLVIFLLYNSCASLSPCFW